MTKQEVMGVLESALTALEQDLFDTDDGAASVPVAKAIAHAARTWNIIRTSDLIYAPAYPGRAGDTDFEDMPPDDYDSGDYDGQSMGTFGGARS